MDVDDVRGDAAASAVECDLDFAAWHSECMRNGDMSGFMIGRTTQRFLSAAIAWCVWTVAYATIW